MIKGFKDKEAGKIWQGLASRRFPKNIQNVARRKLRMLNNGEILLEEFLKPMGLSQNALARAMDVSPRRINEIVLKKRASPRIPLCVWPLPSGHRNNSGWDCRPISIWKKRKKIPRGPFEKSGRLRHEGIVTPLQGGQVALFVF